MIILALIAVAAQWYKNAISALSPWLTAKESMA